MRGSTVVLYVAVLLSAFSIALGALNCGANGDATPSSISPASCICKSGFSGASCDVSASGCDVAVVYPDAEVADNFPKLNDTEGATFFRANTLNASIVGDHVANRTYLELTFTNSTEAKCSFGTEGSWWTMKFGCQDKFFLALPWVNHTQCGFRAVTDPAVDQNKFLIISNTLHLKYNDWVYVDMGINEETNQTEVYLLERTVSIPYRMSVKFQRYIEVQMLALNITSDVKFGAALTGDEYDPESGVLTLTLTSIINYPNSFKGQPSEMEFFAPLFVDVLNYTETAGSGTEPGPILYKNAENIQTSNPGCPNDRGVCTQVWEVRLKLNPSTSNCTFDGDYRLSMTLYTCRDTVNMRNQDCTHTYSHINFTITTSNVCGSIDVEPVVNGTLVPFKHGVSVAGAVPPPISARRKSFKLGEFGNFFALIESAGNDIKINFTDVCFKVKDADDSTLVYLLKNSVVNATHSLAKLELYHADKHFQLYFHSSVFPVPPDSQVTYTFKATVDILFEGNEGEQRKRSVMYTFDTDSLSAEANVFLSTKTSSVAPVADKSVTETSEGVNQTTFIAAVVGAIAGTMIIVFVVVGVALRSRNQSSQRDAAASAAVVAANAAAQSIEVVSRV